MICNHAEDILLDTLVKAIPRTPKEEVLDFQGKIKIFVTSQDSYKEHHRPNILTAGFGPLPTASVKFSVPEPDLLRECSRIASMEYAIVYYCQGAQPCHRLWPNFVLNSLASSRGSLKNILWHNCSPSPQRRSSFGSPRTCRS